MRLVYLAVTAITAFSTLAEATDNGLLRSLLVVKASAEIGMSQDELIKMAKDVYVEALASTKKGEGLKPSVARVVQVIRDTATASNLCSERSWATDPYSCKQISEAFSKKYGSTIDGYDDVRMPWKPIFPQLLAVVSLFTDAAINDLRD